jgi:hypothetical protein
MTKDKGHRRKYTEEDLNFLVNNYLTMTNKKLAAAMNRTKGSVVQTLCNKLGLRRPPRKRPVKIDDRYGRLTVLEETRGKEKGKYWICNCDCGKTVTVSGHGLKRGKTLSCGCYQAEIRRIVGLREPGETSYRRKFNLVRRGAIHRDIPFELTFDQCKFIMHGNCVYCAQIPQLWNTYLAGNGVPKEKRDEYKMNPATIERANIYVNSIDRIDSDKGYTLDNCVPCCHPCNAAKLDFTIQEFREQTKARYALCEEFEKRAADFVSTMKEKFKEEK